MFPQPATMPDPLSMKSRMLGKQMGRTVGSMSNLIGTFRLRMATSYTGVASCVISVCYFYSKNIS